MLGVFLPMMTVVLVEAAALEWLTGTDSEPVEGIQKNVEHELDSRFFLDFGIDFASKRNWDGCATLGCKSQQKVHLLVSCNH
jgi:hypothetical protein